IVYVVARQRIAAAIAGRFGETLLKFGQGKIRDPNLFIQHRLSEALWLATLALLLVFVQLLCNRLARARIRRERWVVQGMAAFVLLNLWIAAAMNKIGR